MAERCCAAGRWVLGVAAVLALVPGPRAQQRYEVAAPVVEERAVGPYSVHVLLGGSELLRPVPPASHVLKPEGPWTLSLWVEMTARVPRTTLLAGVGQPTTADSRFLGLRDGKAMLRLGHGREIVASAPLQAEGWHLLSASGNGSDAVLYVDGKQAGQGADAAGPLLPVLIVGPNDQETGTPGMALSKDGLRHFGGDVAEVTLLPVATDAAGMRAAFARKLDVALLRWDEASPPWPLQSYGEVGYVVQQDPSLLPVSRAPLGKGVAKPLPPVQESLVSTEPGKWTLANGWWLAAAPGISADGAALSAAGYKPGTTEKGWMQATVPGTVLTTMVDRGVYPDPDYGLNNLAIPESLAHQDYWYRVEFETPKTQQKRMTLTMNGINFAAEAWLNGKRLGDVRGAFQRGSFDVSGLLQTGGRNALAVRVSPPPHVGLPQEESMAAGPGENGGAMLIDGPTFLATEGWDWIPTIRDRDTGIWQDVVLTAADRLELGDPQVVTRLPLPDVSSADVEVTVPVRNVGDAATDGIVRASFEGVAIEKNVTLQPGVNTVRLTSAEFPQLTVQKPRLWWPNGYGSPELYHLKLSVSMNGSESDTRTTTFGIREVTYELSLFDREGDLRRVEVSPTDARALHQRVVNVTHEGMRRRQDEFAASSLTAEGESSAAVKPVTDEAGFTDLVLKVNGVRIAARGGNWGMDDSRKRVSREKLEPYFRLHREAGVNIIRNWLGQNSEETFYQLADEYGLMVWNDFWESTQDDNAEAQDIPLFMSNARDVVRRFRNHPSIVMWCARNEGVPQPVLNTQLIDLFESEDGTRYYTPGSNRINLRNSGPYSYQDPALYYTKLDKGFSVELGISSMSTLESFQASIAPEDQWPISDAWTYHDWHWSGNGDVHPMMQAMERQFGAATSLKDFERKAQMFNYVDHRAIFEGFNQHLWQPNSGRMLWMTQSAWPSNCWQILSSDYDTNGAFYGVKKALEPLHVQLDLSDYTVAAVNTTGADAGGATVEASVFSLTNATLFEKSAPVELKANAAQPLFALALQPLLEREPVVLVRLVMRDAGGKVVSRNVYWLAADDLRYRAMSAMAPAALTTSAHARTDGKETAIDLQLTNRGTVAAVATKATLLQKNGTRILPAYYSDNYVTVLPGESLTVTVHVPENSPVKGASIGLRGWNVPETAIAVR